MSASLVGSEMCIRDSIYPAYFAERLAGLSGAPRLPRFRVTLQRPAYYGCLLYTSDAADDM
eukprot:4376490-Alexandrium_andersonii.AAC.1